MLRRHVWLMLFYFFFFKQKTAYEMRISDWSSDVCSSDLRPRRGGAGPDVGRTSRLITGTSERLSQPSASSLNRLGDRFEGRMHLGVRLRIGLRHIEIGRASCRERVCQYV